MSKTGNRWEDTAMNGTIKTVTNKGFGFVRAEGSGTEYFFHRDDYLGQWDELENDFSRKSISVEFTEVPSGRGPRAANVRRID